MKTKILLFLITVFGTISLSFSQDVYGYTHHSTDGGVSLYYKKSDHGIIFRAVNKRNKEINVKIYGVTYTTEYGNKKEKDVLIRWVYPNKASNGGVSSYGKIGAWSFDRWRWTEGSFND